MLLDMLSRRKRKSSGENLSGRAAETKSQLLTRSKVEIMSRINSLPTVDSLSALFGSRTFEKLSRLKDESTILVWNSLPPRRAFELLDCRPDHRESGGDDDPLSEPLIIHT